MPGCLSRTQAGKVEARPAGGSEAAAAAPSPGRGASGRSGGVEETRGPHSVPTEDRGGAPHAGSHASRCAACRRVGPRQRFPPGAHRCGRQQPPGTRPAPGGSTVRATRGVGAAVGARRSAHGGGAGGDRQLPVVSCFWGAGGSAARECARGARPRTRPPGGKGARSGSPLPTDMSPATIASVLTAAPLATVRRTATSDRRGRGGPSHGAGDRSPPLRTPPNSPRGE